MGSSKILLVLFIIFSCKQIQPEKKAIKLEKADSMFLDTNKEEIQTTFKSDFKIHSPKETGDKSFELNNGIKFEAFSVKSFDFNSDGKMDFIVQSNNKDNMIEEHWINDKFEIVQTEVYHADINEMYFLDINQDGLYELIRVRGWTDGVDYSISEFKENKFVVKFYFIPFLELIKKYEDVKYYHAYWDELDSLVVESNKIKVSLDNLDLDYNPEMAINQNVLPVLIFKPKNSYRTKQELQKEIKSLNFYSYGDLLSICNL